MFNFVRLSDGGQPPPTGDLRSEVEVVCGLAARLLPPGPFPFHGMTSHRAIREAIAAVVPGYAAIGEIDTTRREFHIDGRTFHEPRFGTPSGKLRAGVPPTRTFDVAPGEFSYRTQNRSLNLLSTKADAKQMPEQNRPPAADLIPLVPLARALSDDDFESAALRLSSQVRGHDQRADRDPPRRPHP